MLKNAHNSSRLSQIQSLIVTLDKQLGRRFSHLESQEMYAEATIFDPRLKNRCFIHEINLKNALQTLKLKVGRRLQQQQPPIYVT